MDIRKLDETISVSPQISAADIAAIAKAGFSTIICNRPDGEEAGQPDFASIAQAADKAGLHSFLIPISSGAPSQTAIADFTDAIRSSEGPVFAYCRTGTRSSMLWALSRLNAGEPASAVFAATRAAGYALTGLEEHFGYAA